MVYLIQRGAEVMKKIITGEYLLENNKEPGGVDSNSENNGSGTNPEEGSSQPSAYSTSSQGEPSTAFSDQEGSSTASPSTSKRNTHSGSISPVRMREGGVKRVSEDGLDEYDRYYDTLGDEFDKEEGEEGREGREGREQSPENEDSESSEYFGGSTSEYSGVSNNATSSNESGAGSPSSLSDSGVVPPRRPSLPAPGLPSTSPVESSPLTPRGGIKNNGKRKGLNKKKAGNFFLFSVFFSHERYTEKRF
jgi:hypothetical protein